MTTMEPPSVTQTTQRYFPPKQGEWTYEEYARLPDNGMRYEVIGGKLYMSPAPRTKHQDAALNLGVSFVGWVRKNKSGKIYVAPIDVRLPDLADPVQPDILFIAKDHLDIIKEKFIEGIPDLIIEILSPGDQSYDRQTKFQIYARAGVKEYWMVDPDVRTVEIYVLRGDAYALLGNFGVDDEAYSEVLTGFSVPVQEIFTP